jgi:D-arabinose 1-dehydrogenase-like Zn-dependent alcohol dehydrogenase
MEMFAARFDASSRTLSVVERPVPAPGPLDVLVRVEACGICLSDVHLMDGGIPPIIPEVTPGHEAAGEIAAVGELVQGWRPGDRVVMMGGRVCGKCARCRVGGFDECLQPEIMGFHYDGAWADYVLVPHYAIAPAPKGVPVEQAAILADAVATPYGALVERAQLRPGESIGLWGIGGLGTHAVQIARLVGAAPVIAVDPLASARERALDVGADAALDPTSDDVRAEVYALTNDLGLDVAIDLVGANAVLREAVSCLGRGGRAVMVGLSMEPLELEPSLVFGVRSHAVLGHLGYSKRHLEDLVRLTETGRLDLSRSISDVIPLADVEYGVKRLAEKIGDPVRIVVKP